MGFVEAYCKNIFCIFCMNPPKRKVSDHFLDVTEYILTDHRWKFPSPQRSPNTPIINEVLPLISPNSREQPY
jgi:hypothetical protein